MMDDFVYHPSLEHAKDFDALLDEEPSSERGGISAKPATFQFGNDKCVVIYSKVRVIDNTKAMEFIRSLK